MHTGALRKLALALTFWLALHMSTLKAQTLPLGSYTSSTASFEVDTNGQLWDAGTFGTTDALSLSGAGTRMFWYPKLSAFRAGTVISTEWDIANIGAYSTAFGIKTIASNTGSFAIGLGTTASGRYSFASGGSTIASGIFSAAFNNANASGYDATGFGCSTIAAGADSVAMGSYTSASGYAATSVGHQNSAGGDASFSGGFSNYAGADFSTVFGYANQVNSYDSFVVGRYAIGGGNPTQWMGIDPLFEVGNGAGTGSTPLTDAFVVYKNGSAALQGSLTVAPAGDIPMYTGN